MTPDLLLIDVRSQSNGLGIHLVTAPWIPQGIRLHRRRARRRKTSIERRCQTPHMDDGKGAIITLGCFAPRALCLGQTSGGENRCWSWAESLTSEVEVLLPPILAESPHCLYADLTDRRGRRVYLKLSQAGCQTWTDTVSGSDGVPAAAKPSKQRLRDPSIQEALPRGVVHPPEPQKVYSKVHGGSSSAANASHGC